MRLSRTLSCSALLVAALVSRGAAQKQINERRAVGARSSIRISNLVGAVKVTGWDRDSIAVTGTIADDQRFEMGAGPYGAKMYLDGPSGAEIKPATFEVRVPSGARVWVKTGNADIEVSGIVGGLDLNIVGGRIRVTGSPRELNAEAMDGSIEIEGSPAWLRAKSATGAITLRGSSEDAGFTTVSGLITVIGARFERGRFESVTGDMKVSAAPAMAGSLEFDTHAGTIDLKLATGASADVDVSTIHGTINNGLTSQLPLQRADGRGNELGTRVGKGGALVRIRSFKGAVLLGRQ
ncbi:MAG: DUF4097 family beta strand repeat-containing protein [Gemmatimonadaceae bacterium]